MISGRDLERPLDRRMIDHAHLHLAGFTRLHNITVGIKRRPTLIDTVVRIIPRKQLAQYFGSFGVLCFEISQFLVGKPEHMRHVLVDQPRVFGQLTDDFETKWIASVRCTRLRLSRQ